MKKAFFVSIFFLLNYGASALIDTSIISIDTSITSIDTSITTIDTSITTIDTSITTIENIEKTPKEVKKTFLGFLKEDGNKPKKAAFYSTIFPGGGQIYNKQYWKAPIALAAVGGAGYSIYFNTIEYHRYRNAYRIRIDDDPTTFDEFFDNPNATEEALTDARDNHRKWLEQSYIAIVAIHGLNVLEAYTSAHLSNFDIDEDLSLNWQPTVKMQNTLINTSNVAFGISMQLVNKIPNAILNF